MLQRCALQIEDGNERRRSSAVAVKHLSGGEPNRDSIVSLAPRRSQRPSPNDMQGWVKMKEKGASVYTSVLTGYDQRYMTLLGSTISIYLDDNLARNPEQTLTCLLLSVQIDPDKVTEGKFNLQTPELSLKLKTETEYEAKEWVDTIQQAIQASLSGMLSSDGDPVGSAGSGAHNGNGNDSDTRDGGGGGGGGGGGILSSFVSSADVSSELYSNPANRVCADCGAPNPEWYVQ